MVRDVNEAREALVMGALLALPALAQDDAAGRKVVAGACQSCHGFDGLAKMPEMPNIAGDDASYIVHPLKAYRGGVRQNELMPAVTPMLDDAKIAGVAAYYSSLRVTVAPPSGSD